MKKFLSSVFLLGGVVFSIAAVPVFGQSDEAVINKKPLKDFATYIKAQNIDWTKSFHVEVETVLTKNGKFDREKTKFTKTEGDAETVEAVKRAFEAAEEGGWFGHLRNQGIDNIKISARQTAEDFSVSLVSEQPTRERANTISAGLQAVVSAVLLMNKNGMKKLGDDEQSLLNNTTVTTSEKTVNINVSLPASVFQEMINRRLNGGKVEKTAK